MQELHRSSTDYILLGVCGGLGEYFHISSAFIRLLFIIFFFAGGASLLIYIALVLIMPASNNAPTMQGSAQRIKDTFTKYTAHTAHDAGINDHTEQTHNVETMPPRVLAGLILFFFGLYVLLAKLGIAMSFDMGLFLPLLFILLGIVLFFKQRINGNTIVLLLLLVFVITAIASLQAFH